MSGDASQGGDAEPLDPPPTPEQADGDWERIITRMARLKADLSRAERQLAEVEEEMEDPLARCRARSTVSFAADDFNRLIEEVVEYVEGGEGLPETCPVCGEEVTPPGDLSAGESYEAIRFCVTEEDTGLDHGILHFEGGGDGDRGGRTGGES
jgi:DNA repair exonuclease SbcCD ATPase subunit